MMRIFLDTNVILDYLIPTNAFHEEASSLIEQCLEGSVRGFVSSHSLTDIFYIVRKSFSVEERRLFLLMLVSNFTVIPESGADFLSVLNAEGFFDLEDGLQMRCAENEKLDFIVTENLKDFESSSVSAVSIQKMLAILKNDSKE